MVTLLTYGNSDTMHRCDATCYDAKPGRPCHCICGGANHAAGFDLALRQTRELGERWLEEWKRQQGDLTAPQGLFDFVSRGRRAQAAVDQVLRKVGGQEVQP